MVTLSVLILAAQLMQVCLVNEVSGQICMKNEFNIELTSPWTWSSQPVGLGDQVGNQFRHSRERVSCESESFPSSLSMDTKDIGYWTLLHPLVGTCDWPRHHQWEARSGKCHTF